MAGKVDEYSVLDRVLDRLNEDPRVDASQVGVEISHHGKATLRGTVSDWEAREAAEEDAARTEGVKKVFNYLTVPVPGPVPAGGAEAGGEEGILDRIGRALMGEKVLASEDIDATFEDGRAILEGSVNAFWKRNRAGEVALGVEGVREVTNRLAVVPTHARDDREIAGQIMDALAGNFFIDEEAVDVKVNKALVTLRGTVPSARARHEAFLAALYVEGVVDVRDELKIAPAEK